MDAREIFEATSGGLLLAVLVGVFVGVGSFTFFYADGGDYFKKEPESCANCHVMQPHYDSWIKSSHTNVATCADCHMPDEFVPSYVAKADNGFRHAWAFTFQNFEEPIRIIPRNSRILQQRCIDCHGGMMHDIVDENNEPECVECHNDVGHGPRR